MYNATWKPYPTLPDQSNGIGQQDVIVYCTVLHTKQCSVDYTLYRTVLSVLCYAALHTQHNTVQYSTVQYHVVNRCSSNTLSTTTVDSLIYCTILYYTALYYIICICIFIFICTVQVGIDMHVHIQYSTIYSIQYTLRFDSIPLYNTTTTTVQWIGNRIALYCTVLYTVHCTAHIYGTAFSTIQYHITIVSYPIHNSNTRLHCCTLSLICCTILYHSMLCYTPLYALCTYRYRYRYRYRYSYRCSYTIQVEIYRQQQKYMHIYTTLYYTVPLCNTTLLLLLLYDCTVQYSNYAVLVLLLLYARLCYATLHSNNTTQHIICICTYSYMIYHIICRISYTVRQGRVYKLLDAVQCSAVQFLACMDTAKKVTLQ